MHNQSHKTDLNEVRQYIEDNYTKQLTLTQLAQVTCLSPSYLSSAFKQQYTQSPMEYVTQLRIHKAKQLMQQEDVRLKYIAEAVGYNDEFYFSRVFKKAEGVSPTTYMSLQKKHIGVVTGNMMGYLHAIGIKPYAAPLSAKWTPYYYNLWMEQMEHRLPLIDNERYCDLTKLLYLPFDLVISPKDLPADLVRTMKEHLPIYLLDDKRNCLSELTELADLLNKHKEAKQWMEQYTSRLEEIRKQLGWWNRPPQVLVIRIYKSQIFAYCNAGIHHLLFQDLGAVSSYKQDGLYNAILSSEELGAMKVDRLLTLIGADDQSRATWHHLQRKMEFKQLDAVQHQQSFVIHSDPWNEYSPIALQRMLEEVAVMMTS